MGCRIAFEVSGLSVLVSSPVVVLDEPELVEVTDVEPEGAELASNHSSGFHQRPRYQSLSRLQ